MMCPPLGSTILNKDMASVDFPEPVLPTCATNQESVRSVMHFTRSPTHNANLLCGSHGEGKVLQDSRKMWCISDYQILHHKFSVARRPCCGRSLLLDDGRSLLRYFKVLDDTLDRVEVEFYLGEDPAKMDVSTVAVCFDQRLRT